MSTPRLSFRFERCLGRSGDGEVYLAQMSRPGGGGRHVAVKVLKPDLRRADEAVQRLRDEGRMLAVLDHPSILRALEMTLIGGRVALVTEYIDGVDLARCCREPRLLPHRAVVQAIGEIASALDTAWNTPSPETGKPLELIHRDIKPANLRVSSAGDIKILDFGIARTTEMYRHAKTAQGSLPFTRGTAAPEAFTKGFQGSASDVYALGITFFRMLAGQHFYAGLELSDQVNTVCLDERYTPYLRRRLEILEVPVPSPVIQLVRSMLAYEAADRPSASSVAATASALVGGMTGPSLREWAVSMEFPEPAGVEGGSLTGQTLYEDAVEGASAASIKRNPSLVLDNLEAHTDVGPDGDELPVAPPPPRVSSIVPAAPRSTIPPPVPRSLSSNSIKPYTAPTALGALIEKEAARVAPRASDAPNTLDGFSVELADPIPSPASTAQTRELEMARVPVGGFFGEAPLKPPIAAPQDQRGRSWWIPLLLVLLVLPILLAGLALLLVVVMGALTWMVR